MLGVARDHTPIDRVLNRFPHQIGPDCPHRIPQATTPGSEIPGRVGNLGFRPWWGSFLGAHTILGDSMHLVDAGRPYWEKHFRAVMEWLGGIDAFAPLV